MPHAAAPVTACLTQLRGCLAGQEPPGPSSALADPAAAEAAAPADAAAPAAAAAFTRLPEEATEAQALVPGVGLSLWHVAAPQPSSAHGNLGAVDSDLDPILCEADHANSNLASVNGRSDYVVCIPDSTPCPAHGLPNWPGMTQQSLPV